MGQHSKPSHSDSAGNKQTEQDRIRASRQRLRDSQSFAEAEASEKAERITKAERERKQRLQDLADGK